YYDDLNQTHPEIRRFTIDIASGRNIYQELEAKIAQLNSDYVNGQFTLQYIDEDKDRITFSSNDELRSAISVNNDGLIKIFVKSKQQQRKGDENIHHAGVICDGCQGHVYGIRYKCVECPDYDLCETCMSKGLHSEHNMLILIKPWSRHCPYLGGHRFGKNLSSFGVDPKMSTTTTNDTNPETAKLEEAGAACSSASTCTEPKTNPPSSQPSSTTTTGASANVSPWEQLASMFTTMMKNQTAPATNEADEEAREKKKIDECVERMTAMGFMNTNGVLAELIKAKNGDLNQVLDALNPRNYNKN
ncbi:unnamed protein product, partial [Didymodactylos carnosus]